MRKPIIVANWKMYTRAADAAVLATTVRNGLAKVEGLEVVLCPPVIWLSEIRKIIGRGSRIELGAQNIFYEPEGAYTGEISPLMVLDLARYVIIGHSERREYFGETNLDVNEKTIAALRANLAPIVCVGERRRKNNPKETVAELTEALTHVPKKRYEEITLAYEPVWAIGTGDNAEPEYAAAVLTLLREVIGPKSSILYGGSVNTKNIAGYADRPEIDGVLVGGASLRASEFVKICKIWQQRKNFR